MQREVRFLVGMSSSYSNFAFSVCMQKIKQLKSQLLAKVYALSMCLFFPPFSSDASLSFSPL